MKDNKLTKAACAFFEAEKTRAEANLEIYLKNSVAVAEHPDLVGEIINLTKTIAEADECLKVLKTMGKKK